MAERPPQQLRSGHAATRTGRVVTQPPLSLAEVTGWPPLSWSALLPIYFFFFYKWKVNLHTWKIWKCFLKISIFSVCFYENTKMLTKQFLYVDPTDNTFQMWFPLKTLLNSHHIKISFPIKTQKTLFKKVSKHSLGLVSHHSKNSNWQFLKHWAWPWIIYVTHTFWKKMSPSA